MNNYDLIIRSFFLLSISYWLFIDNVKAQIAPEYASGEVKYTDNKAIPNVAVKFYVNGGLYRTTTTDRDGGYNVELSPSIIKQIETMGGIEVEIRVIIDEYIYPFKKTLENKQRRKIEDLILMIDRNIQFFRGEVINTNKEHLPGIFVLIHGISNAEQIRDSTYTDREGIFYFKIPKGSYTIDMVFIDELKKYKDAYQNRFALPMAESYVQTLVSHGEDSLNIISLQMKALTLKEIAGSNYNKDNEAECLKGNEFIKQGDINLKQQQLDIARDNYDRARIMYASIFNNALQEGTSGDAYFWKSEALIAKSVVHKPKTKEDKALLAQTDSLFEKADELYLNNRYKGASLLFQKAFAQYNILFVGKH